jgi:hypothetical protein
MNDIFRPLLRRTVIVFFDDILVYSTDMALHLTHLRQVFEILAAHEFHLKVSKCSFGQAQVSYLGHVVEHGKVAPDPAKVQAVLDWPPPKTVKGLRGFLGLSGFYRKFIQHYATLAEPLTSLLKKDAFHWSPVAQQAMDALKHALATAPVLALPDFSIPFIVQTDASGHAMGAVLLQNDHPIAYFSRLFCPRLSKASTYIRELHAITCAVKRWRQYLLGHHFVIQTDHRSLKELLTQVIQTPEQQFYLSKLLGYHYDIEYKSGKTNIVADALSRSFEVPVASLHVLSTPQFLFVDELKSEQLTDPAYLELKGKIEDSPASYPDFSLNDGLLLRCGKIWVSPTSRFKLLLLQEYHESPIGGHAGVVKTLKRLSANFFWPNMRQEVQKFIASCVVCQQTKYSTLKPGGLLQPLPIPANVWEDISLDFVTGLPLSNGYSVMLVVVDRFSKAIHLGALPGNFTAYKVAELFVHMVIKHHGFPKSIVSDHDPIFISRFWSDLFKFSGTLLRMSSSYHPQTDGQTEVTNRVVEQYLRAFVHAKPSLWHRFLPWAELHFNTSYHSASGLTPYQVVYGKPPPQVMDYIAGTSLVDACDKVLTTRDEILALLCKNLLKAQARMKLYADKKRREVTFDVGSWVYVQLRPYRQTSLSGVKFSKLNKRYYGPFKVVARVGSVAYKLELPSYSKIHDVFHSSVLKPHQGPAPHYIDQLPDHSIDNHPVITPLAILDSKTEVVDGVAQKMVLVQWVGLSPDDTSWERWDELKASYNLEDKVGLDGEGDDTYTPKITTGDAGPSQVESIMRPKRSIVQPQKYKGFVLYK